MRNPLSFQQGLRAYRLLPGRLIVPASFAVIISELLFGAFFLVSSDTLLRVASAGSTGILLTFTVAQLINFRRGTGVSCHCFGSDPLERVSIATLSRSAALAVLSAALFLLPSSQMRLYDNSILALFTIALAVVTLVRTAGVFPIALRAFRMRAIIAPSTSGRVSFRHSGLDVSLVMQSGKQSAQR